MNERTENEVQQLFLGKYLTQKRTALLKKAFTQITTVLPQKNESRSILASSCGFLHETGFLRFVSSSHFIDGRVFLKVPALKWCVFFLNRLTQ